MKYYLLMNRSMPWGDYGAMLFSGLLKVLDEHYDDLEYKPGHGHWHLEKMAKARGLSQRPCK